MSKFDSEKFVIYIVTPLAIFLPLIVWLIKPFSSGQGTVYLVSNAAYVFTLLYFVVFMPLVAFLLMLVVPFYMFKLKTISHSAQIMSLSPIVAALMVMGFLFFWLNVNIRFIEPFYGELNTWFFSWLTHVGVIILIVAPLYTQERKLLNYLLASLFIIIMSTNYLTFGFLSFLKTKI